MAKRRDLQQLQAEQEEIEEQEVEEQEIDEQEEDENGPEIMLARGDITKLEVDAIVNAAHEGLCGGGGVDGAIHKAAGPELAGECMNQLYGCPVGQCRITNAYKLPASYVIHTVGPVWSQKKKDNIYQEAALRMCYINCLKMANLQGLKTIAFPCISTGAFAFPKKKAARIALDAIENFLENDNITLELVCIVCLDEENYNYYNELMFEEEENE